MSLIKGVHHVALKAKSSAEFLQGIHFYRDILGLGVLREWKGGIMLSTGDGIIEIFDEGKVSSVTGSIHHIGLETDDVDACIDAVVKEGYKVTTDPADMVIPSTPCLPIRMAFCIGPFGEEIEFITIKK